MQYFLFDSRSLLRLSTVEIHELFRVDIARKLSVTRYRHKPQAVTEELQPYTATKIQLWRSCLLLNNFLLLLAGASFYGAGWVAVCVLRS